MPTIYKNKRMQLAALAIVAALLLLLSSLTTQRIVDTKLLMPWHDSVDIELPYLENMPNAGASYVFTGRVHRDVFASPKWTIKPDDQVLWIKVNGEDIDLSHISPDQLKNVQTGFNLNLSHVLKSGANEFEVKVRDFGGNMGLSIEPSLIHWKPFFLILAWLVLLLFVLKNYTPVFQRRWQHSVLYGGIVVGVFIKIYTIFSYNPLNHIFSDPARHWEQGTDLFRIDLMSMTDPVFYQLYVAFIAKLSLKIPAIVALITSVVAISAPWFWYKFIRELKVGKTLALSAWAFLSLLPSWTSIYSYFMQETLLLPLLGLSLWMTWRCRRKQTVGSFVLMVFLWAITGLTRGIAIPIAAVCCTWLWLVQPQPIKKALCSLGVLALVLGPLTYRAYQTVNHFAPHGMGHLNVIYSKSGKKTIRIATELGGARWVHVFGSPSTGAKPFEPLSSWSTRREGQVSASIDLDEGMRDWSTEIDKIDTPISDYFWILKENLIFLFFAESWPDNNQARLLDWLNTWLRWLWFPLTLFVLFLVVKRWSYLRRDAMLPCMILAWFIVQGLLPIAINEGRYRKPFEGLLIAQLCLVMAVRRRRYWVVDQLSKASILGQVNYKLKGNRS